MWQDVVDLRDFYCSDLGQVARHLLRARIRSMWPDLRGQSLLGLGYATPYLRQFIGEAERVLAAMPEQQGVLPWPPEGPGIVALAESDVHMPVNIGNPSEFTLLELAKAVIEVTGSRSEIVHEALPVDDPQQRRPDIARARDLLGWEPKVELIDGLRKTIELTGVERLVGATD